MINESLIRTLGEPSDDGTWLLPHLNTITYDWGKGDAESYSVSLLLRIVQARHAAPGTLSVTLIRLKALVFPPEVATLLGQIREFVPVVEVITCQ